MAATAEAPEMAPEKKEESEPENVSLVNGAMTYAASQFLMGIVLLGCLVPILADLENYENIRQPLKEGGSPLAGNLVLPFLLVVVAILMIFAGVLSCIGVSKNSKAFVYPAMVLSMITGLGAIAIGINVTITLEGLRRKLEGNPVSDPTFDDSQISVLDFTAAIYNECCLPTYDSLSYNFEGFTGALTDSNDEIVDLNQREVGVCAEDLETTCPTVGAPMFPQIVIDVFNGLGFDNGVDLLCHCIGDTERFDKFVEIFQRDGMCDKYRKVVVEDVDDIIVPVINVPFRQLIGVGLGSLQSEISSQLPMVRFALVGKILPPDTTFDEPAENIGWSCGLGYAKSVAFYLYLYIDSIVKSATIGAMATGGICLISSVVLMSMWLCCNLDRPYEAGDDGYGEVEYGDEYGAAPRKKQVPNAVAVKEKEDEEYA